MYGERWPGGGGGGGGFEGVGHYRFVAKVFRSGVSQVWISVCLTWSGSILCITGLIFKNWQGPVSGEKLRHILENVILQNADFIDLNKL